MASTRKPLQTTLDTSCSSSAQLWMHPGSHTRDHAPSINDPGVKRSFDKRSSDRQSNRETVSRK